MKTKTSKGMRKEILDILTNYNNLQSENEFVEIQYQLYEACQKGNLELIKIYLSETIENDLSNSKLTEQIAQHHYSKLVTSSISKNLLFHEQLNLNLLIF